MPLRRTAPLASALLALACQPSVPYDQASNPSSVSYAGFDPTGTPPSIPLPNDLAFLSISSQSPAQQALLNIWAKEGGFPSDQEVPITIDFVTITPDPQGNQVRSAPAIDTSSINSSNFALFQLTGPASAVPFAYSPPQPADYVVNGDHGTLSIHPVPAVDPVTKNKLRRWPAGAKLAYAIRGGASGVKIKNSSDVIQPQATMYLLTHCCKTGTFRDPLNQSLLPGNTAADKAAAGAQLEDLRQRYLPLFALLDQAAFPHLEVATLGTFAVAPARGPHVETDPGSGLMPLPSDFLFTNGRLLPDLAAPTGPFGALGPGLAKLDGFSTTAMVLSQTSEPIDATSVAAGAFLYEVGGTPSAPTFTRLKEIAEAVAGGNPAGYAAEPAAITQAATGGTCAASPGVPCVSTAIGLQPAVPVLSPTIALALPPLKENTTYVVLITDQVKTATQKPLVRTTLSNIVFLPSSISIASGGKSTLAGISDAQAAGFDQLRAAVAAAATALAAEKPSLTIDHVVLGYTFHTQSMKATAVKLAELPYGTGNTLAPVSPLATYCAAPGCTRTIADAFAKYGVETGTVNGVPSTGIGAIVEANIVTFNALDPATGAFLDLTNPANQPAPEIITALISLPACTAAPCTFPLAIFRHGFGSSRGAMLTVASTLNTNNIAVAAIDMVKHGDRSFCSANSQCASGGTCNPVAAFAGQGDTTPPGKCSTDFVRTGVLCPGGGACATAPSGTPTASSNYLVSANFFRTRDSFRQDIIDESQLIRVLSTPGVAANAITTPSPINIQIDPTRIWYVGQSLGSINGTVSVAANVRVAKAVLNVGGGTAVDIFSQSPAFATSTNALLASLGITPGTADYLRFINVAKWILDPAEPINFAINLNAKTLPSVLSGGAAPPARPVLSQIANCDQVVPNPFNLNLHGNLGAAATVVQELMLRAAGSYSSIALTATSCPIQELRAGGGSVPHGILTNWGFNNGSPDAGLHGFTQTIQTDIANFFAGTNPPATQTAP